MSNDPLRQRKFLLERAVGDAVGRWANLEAQLALIFANALRLSTRDACKLLVKVKTFSLMLDLVDAAVKIRLPDDAHARWNSIVALVRELSGDRNYIAHTSIVLHGPGDPNDPSVWKDADAKIGPSIIAHMAELRKKDPISLEEALELIEDIQQAVELIMEFSALFQTPDASRDTLVTKIARRRPPRAQRQGSEPQIP